MKLAQYRNRYAQAIGNPGFEQALTDVVQEKAILWVARRFPAMLESGAPRVETFSLAVDEPLRFVFPSHRLVVPKSVIL